MKPLFIQRVCRRALLLIGACASLGASADTTYTYAYGYKWDVSSSCQGSGWLASCGMNGNLTSYSVTPTNPAPIPGDPNAPAGSLSATATGWSNTQGNSDDYASQTLEQGQLQAWSSSGSGSTRRGLGVRNLDYSTSANGGESRVDYDEGTSPEHAVDNNGRFDSILYSFSQEVTLTGVSLSWYSYDSDISVLAFTGDTSAPGFDITDHLEGLRYDQLATNGWTFINHYNGGYDKVVNTTESSSYWLVGAANSLVGGSVDTAKDYMKIAAISGMITNQFTQQTPPSPPAIPEPGSLALFGLGGLLLLHVHGLRGRRTPLMAAQKSL